MKCESKKNAHFESPLGATFKRLNELGRVSKWTDWCQLRPSKSLESFYKKSTDEILSKNDKEIKVSPLMPIRVKTFWGDGKNMHDATNIMPHLEYILIKVVHDAVVSNPSKL